jgi:ubiquinone/menaquinone biosynthesis C-methylase UbiE
VSESWELLTADSAERHCFASLQSTLALPWKPAAPPNRLREVRRIQLQDRSYYLKVFHRTQPKNRLRFAVTRPRTRTDAERELRVTQALAALGIDTPRAVAHGHRGPSSFYLCAELPGTALVNLLREGRGTPELLRDAARFCGDILRRGVILPDLSAEHVYVRPGDRDSGFRFSVLDLHNGSLSSRVPLRSAARVLKHFRRSVKGLSIPRPHAMRFAARLLKAAGLQSRIRAILSRVSAMDTHGRYESQLRAATYRNRKPARTAVELDLLRRVWPGGPGDTVLDAPCGVGRLTPLLMDELGVELVAADRSMSMISGEQTTGQTSPSPQPRPGLTVQADSLALPFAHESLDGTVMFRFLHHLPPDLAQIALAEASRVSRRYLVVSFFHPISAHGLRRRLMELFTRRARTRHVVTLTRLRAWLRPHGFSLHRCGGERRFLREFWLASFVRSAPQ